MALGEVRIPVTIIAEPQGRNDKGEVEVKLTADIEHARIEH